MVFGQRLHRGLVIGLAGATWIAGAATLRAAEGCALPTGGGTKVVSVSEDGDITLADGRIARLAFLDVPDGFADAARTRIATTVGQAVRVIHIGASVDRWGRILALISPSKSDAGSGTQETSRRSSCPCGAGTGEAGTNVWCGKPRLLQGAARV